MPASSPPAGLNQTRPVFHGMRHPEALTARDVADDLPVHFSDPHSPWPPGQTLGWMKPSPVFSRTVASIG